MLCVHGSDRTYTVALLDLLAVISNTCAMTYADTGPNTTERHNDDKLNFVRMHSSNTVRGKHMECNGPQDHVMSHKMLCTQLKPMEHDLCCALQPV